MTIMIRGYQRDLENIARQIGLDLAFSLLNLCESVSRLCDCTSILQGQQVGHKQCKKCRLRSRVLSAHLVRARPDKKTQDPEGLFGAICSLVAAGECVGPGSLQR